MPTHPEGAQPAQLIAFDHPDMCRSFLQAAQYMVSHMMITIKTCCCAGALTDTMSLDNTPWVSSGRKPSHAPPNKLPNTFLYIYIFVRYDNPFEGFLCVPTHMLTLACDSTSVADECCTPGHSLFWQFFWKNVPISLPKQSPLSMISPCLRVYQTRQSPQCWNAFWTGF